MIGRTDKGLAGICLGIGSLLLMLAVAAEISGFDLTLADTLYSWTGNEWSLKKHWLTEGLIHKGGRKLVGVMLALTLVAWALSYGCSRFRRWRKSINYLLCSSLLAVIIVNVLKAWTNVDCPWALSEFGGERPYFMLFENRPENLPTAKCLPAGHASGAYAWIALFFIARVYRPQWQLWVLAGVVGFGFLFGIAQQLRGAHFISHDLWTMAICWLTASGLFFVFFKPSKELYSE